MGNCCTKNNSTVGPTHKKNTDVESAKKKNRTPYNDVVGDEEELEEDEEEEEEADEEEDEEEDEDADTDNANKNGENKVTDNNTNQHNSNEQSSKSKQIDKEAIVSPSAVITLTPTSPQFSTQIASPSFQFQIEPQIETQSQSQPQVSSPRANKTKTIATNFGLTIGIELNDISSFLDDILRKDIQRKDTSASNDNNANRDGMERIWEGCVGKNKTSINNNSDLAKLLYKLTYVTLNTYQKNKGTNNDNNNADNNSKPKAKPDHKSIELAVVPVKQAILEIKYNNVYNNISVENNNNILNAEIEITQDDFKKSFSKYLVRASEVLQQNEQLQQQT